MGDCAECQYHPINVRHTGGTQPTDVQQLQAKIAAIIVRYDLMISNPHCEVPKGLRIDMEELRQLSAVQ